MLLAFIFSLFVVNIAGCTLAEKIKCAAAAAGCGATCVCDIPACECCPVCIACVTATVADCCDCLFPSWSGCYSLVKNTTYIKPKVEVKTTTCYDTCSSISDDTTNSAICCPKNKTAKCSSSPYDEGGNECNCVDVVPKFNNASENTLCQQSCSGASCTNGYGSICCPVGSEAFCKCIFNGNPVCGCS